MRRLLVLAALAACVALVLLLRRDGTPPRAPPLRGLLEGETLRDAPESAEDLPGREPTILTGHVFGPDGRPVEKAEVRVVYPKTYTLVRTGDNGAYELPFDRSGRFLVEAALTIELAPERAWAEVPDHGDPAPVDFRLKPAGAIFGEVTLAGVPVLDAGVELYVIDIFGDAELVHDTSARNGYFNFYFDPPKDVPLRLDVKSDEGILRAALSLLWRGEQMNVGRIDLTPYPSLRIRMRLPDGSHAPEVATTRREDLWVSGSEHFAARFLGRGSRVAIPQESDVTMRLVFVGTERPREEDPATEGRTFMVEREVALVFGQPRELDLIVRPGPFAVTSRLVDERGRGVRARLRCADRDAATGEDGTFQVAVPCGGLHTVRLTALDIPGLGWVELEHAPEHALLLDADDPLECGLDLDGCVLAVAVVPSSVEIRTGRGWAFHFRTGPDGTVRGCLSRKMPPGDYAWVGAAARRDAEGGERLDPISRSGTLRVPEQGLAILDAR